MIESLSIGRAEVLARTNSNECVEAFDIKAPMEISSRHLASMGWLTLDVPSKRANARDPRSGWFYWAG